MVKFGYTILYVKDVAGAVKFYETAFGLVPKFITPENDYAELITGETTLSFASVNLAAGNLPEGFTESNPDHKPFAMEIGMVTEDVEGVFQKALNAGATLVTAPKNKPWGQIVAYVRDPEGFLVEICSPMS